MFEVLEGGELEVFWRCIKQ